MTQDPRGIALEDASADPFDADRAATALVDGDGVLVRWSAAATQLLGFEASEIMGRRAADLLTVASAAEAASGLRRAGQGWHGFLSVQAKGGRAVDLAVRGYPSISPGSEPYWLILATEAARMRRWEEDWAVLAGLFTQSSVGLLIADTDLRCTRRNVALERMTGVPVEERLGRRVGEALPELNAAEIEEAMRLVLDTGVPKHDVLHRGRTPADPDREHVWSTGTFRLQNQAGEVLGLCQSLVDVTDRQRFQERALLLNDATLGIGSTLDVTRTAQELADVAVPRLADTVSVDLLDAVVRGDEPTPGPAEEGVTLRRAAYRSAWNGPARAAFAVGESSRFDPASPHARCMADLQARLVARLDYEGPWLRNDPQRAASMRDARSHSLIVVPLLARNVLMGVAGFYRWQKPFPFDDDDLALATDLATRAAVCIDNARRYTRERATTLSLQRSLLPSGLPELPAVEAAVRYQPAGEDADVGGDWYDVIPLSGARVALVVGDVPGHGMHASATMGRLRTAVHTLADLDLPPDELLTQLDALVARLDEEGDAADDGHRTVPATGATCLYAVYDPVDRRCTLARAGHFPPAIVHPDGTFDLPVLPAGPPLGLGGLPFESAELDLAVGSLLVLYSNGLVQARDPDIDVGLRELRRLLSHPERPLEELSDRVTETLLPSSPPDDVALLVARTRALGRDQVASWDLEADPAFVVEARNLVARQLSEWGLEECLFTTELVVSELVTNAIRYGQPPIRLRIIRDRSLICEVSDGSSTSPHLRRAKADDEGGRGLFLIAQLTEHWGTRYTSSGKTIWTEQPLP